MHYAHDCKSKKNQPTNRFRIFNRALLATLVIGFGAYLLSHDAKATSIPIPAGEAESNNYYSTALHRKPFPTADMEHLYYQDIQSFAKRRWRYSDVAQIGTSMEKCSAFIRMVIEDYHRKGFRTETLHVSKDQIQVKLCEKDNSILASCGDDKMMLEKTKDCSDPVN